MSHFEKLKNLFWKAVACDWDGNSKKSIGFRRTGVDELHTTPPHVTMVLILKKKNGVPQISGSSPCIEA